MTDTTKKIFQKDHSGGTKFLIILLAFILAGMLIANLLTGLVWALSGIEISDVFGGSQLNQSQRNIFRTGLIINHAGTFLLPAFFFCKYYISENPVAYYNFKHWFKLEQLVLWGMAILCSYPVIAQLTEWNSSIPLPEWMISSQSNAFALLEQTLKMEGPGELLISVLLVGVFAALGEELIFRGIVQKHLLSFFHSPHLAIITAALIFGGFHMQFERLLPLSALGLLLGYSYYYSGSIWVPIILHFLNNSFQIVSIYIVTRTQDMPDINEIPDLPLPMVIGALAMTTLFTLWAIRTAPKKNESRP